MVNAENVSITETMQYARHRSVAASKSYQRTDGISEGNRLRAIGLHTSCTTTAPASTNSRAIEEEKEEVVHKEALEEEEFVNFNCGASYDSEDSIQLESMKKRKHQDSTATSISATQKVGFMTQVGISNLEEQMEDLRMEMAANAKRKSSYSTKAMKELPQSTNNKIVQSLITQVEQLKKVVKKMRNEELVHASRENDWAADAAEHRREVWELKDKIKQLELENEEMFFAFQRGEDRTKKADKAYKTRKWRSAGRFEDSSDDEEEVFQRKTRRRKSFF
jgi:hypothetical protein